MKYKSLLLLVLFTFFGCGNSADEERSEAILSANIALTKGNFDEAISILLEAGIDEKNAKYLMTLASAYAGKAGLREPSFVESDLPLSTSPAPLGGIARFSTSAGMTSASDTKMDYLEEAINLLLYAGGLSTTASPSVAQRAELFTSREAAEINTQLLFLILARLGRFARFYGDAGATGVKGSGSNGNDCFLNYQNVALDVGNNLNTYFALGATGACSTGDSGHNSLGTAGSYNVGRACEGIVLINNLLDVLPAVVDSMSSDDLDAISNLDTVISLLRTAMSTAKTGSDAILAVKSQELCESENAADDDYLQVYYAFIFETLFL